MVAGNSYVYQRVRKGPTARSSSASQEADRTRASSSSHRHTSTPGHHYNAHHETKSSSPSGRERERRRSVSPQMQKRLVLSPPSSLPTIESHSVVRKKLPKRAINMADVGNRLKTFECQPSWEVEGVDYYPIASAGLYFTGQEDNTKCFECQVVLSDWSAHDDPVEVHFDKSPNCAYLRKDHPKAVEDLCSSKFDAYKDLAARVKSFSAYPHYAIDVNAIASSGFFYTGADNKTQCFACGFVKSNWEGENPIDIHRNLYGGCPHLKVMDAMSDRMLHTSAAPSVHEVHVAGNEAAGLKKPDYSSASVRRLSFKHYSSHVIDKEDLVDAGFFLLSPPQTVKCFACNLVLDVWLPGENPLKKHYRYNSNCPFLRGKDISSTSIASPPPDQFSFPAPMYTYNEMMSKFKGASVANGHSTAALPENRQEETKVIARHSGSRELFNLPIHLPPKYKLRGATSSSPPYHTYPSTESSTPSTPSDETFHSLNIDEDDKICIICFDKPKEYAIIPCGHLCTCAGCSEKLRNCPVCRRPKQSVIRIYNT